MSISARQTIPSMWLVWLLLNFGCVDLSSPSLVRITVQSTPLQTIPHQQNGEQVFTLAHGQQRQLIALGLYQDGRSREISQLVDWSSAFPSLIAIDHHGKIQANTDNGGSVITAHLDGFSSEPIIVLAEPAQLTEIFIESDSKVLRVGEQTQLHIKGRFSNDQLERLSTNVHWYSSAANAISVSPDGRLHALLAKKNVQITAHVAPNLSTTITLSTLPPTLVELKVVPSELSLPRASSYPLSVVAVYSNGHQKEITDEIRWQSLAPAHAHVDPQGNVTGLNEGKNITIVAHYAQVSSNVTVSVTPSLLSERTR